MSSTARFSHYVWEDDDAASLLAKSSVEILENLGPISFKSLSTAWTRSLGLPSTSYDDLRTSKLSVPRIARAWESTVPLRCGSALPNSLTLRVVGRSFACVARSHEYKNTSRER